MADPEVERLAAGWDALAAVRPFEAILSTVPTGLDENPDEGAFFERGRVEVATDLARLAELGITPFGRALDFGCGMGRLSRALAEHFDEVVGVDVSPRMIELARARAVPPNCSFEVNASEDLRQFGDEDFDFVYCTLVLQHLSPALSARYLEEFVRLLRPGGHLFFQVPAELRQPPELPPELTRAHLEVDVDEEPVAGTASSLVFVRGRVENVSLLAWTKELELGVGRRWVSGETGEVVVWAEDGSRVPLDRRLAPGESEEFALSTVAPSLPGHYILELDVSQPGRTWFGDLGSTRLQVHYEIKEGPTDEEGAPFRRGGEATGEEVALRGLTDDETPGGDAAMVMNALSPDEVASILERRGGEVIARFEDESAGPEWLSYRYVARRASGT